MIYENGVLRFGSGRVIRANAGVIGIDHTGRAYEGYDSLLDECYTMLLPEERKELARFMIARWSAFGSILVDERR